MNNGSCNFTALDTVKLNIRLADSDIRRYHLADPDYLLELGPEIGTGTRIVVYGINYNVLQIDDGMAQLQFSM
jgi:hypothetical protein